MSEQEPATLDELKAIAAKHKAIVVDFYATWCGPCVRIGPYIHDQCHKNGVPLVKVNVDVNGEASSHYGIQAMPTFKVLDTNGKEIFSKTGGSNPVVDAVIA